MSDQRFIILIVITLVLVIGLLTGLVILGNHIAPPSTPHQVDAIINGLVYIPSHYVGVTGKGGHNVSDEWDIHCIYFEDGTDKIIVKQVTQQEFNSYERGQRVTITIP